MLEYILKTSICWLAFYAVYYLFLRKETFFKINRVYLIATVCLGAAIPLLHNLFTIAPTETIAVYIAPLNMDLLNDHFVVVAPVEDVLTIDWFAVLYGVYVLGALIMLVRFVFGLFKIYALYQSATLQRQEQIQVVSTKEVHLPFSFFNMLFISELYEVAKEDKEKIILHEKAHIEGGHSFDVILMELLAIVFWCSPLIYLYKKSIKTVHEYLADDKVLQTTSTQSYGHLLLSHSQAGMQVDMANHFIHSQLKQRIIMMTRNKSTRKNLIKYALMLPVLFALVVVFAQSDITNFNNNATIQQSSIEVNVADEIFSKPENLENIVSKIDKINHSKENEPSILDYNKRDTSRIYKVVEQMPRFPGCEEEADSKSCAMQKMLEFIYTNIKYPATARESGIQGTNVVRFVVEKDGTIKNAELIRDIGGGCGEESLKVVNMMPNWIPGKENGENVAVQFNLPIKFKLQDEEEVENSNEIAGTVYDKVDQMPRFPGCEEAKDRDACSQQKLLEFIYGQVKYPNQARLDGIEGVAVIKFVVDESGKIVNPEIVRDIAGGCGEESLRVVKSMPDWIPGREEGKVVPVQINLPIKFALSKPKIEHAVESSMTINNENVKVLPNGVKATPRFPGCEDIVGNKNECANQKMYSFIYDNIRYPKSLKRDQIKGEMRVRFSIDERGAVNDAVIGKGIHKDLDKEVLRVIRLMPNWIPGVASSDILNITISIPVSFNANNPSKDYSQRAFIDGNISPKIKDELKTIYFDTYESDVSHGGGFTKEKQDDYILTFKAIEMTMKEHDSNATLNVGTGEGEDKSQEEWLRHLEQALGELQNLSSTDQEFKELFQRVGQNKVRILHGQK